MKLANTQLGFTLVELMFTLFIAAIFLTMAVPSYTTFTKNNRVTTVTNDLVTDISVARSEAVSRGKQVVVCRSANPIASSPTCGGSANTWTTGWLLFVSGDSNNTYDSATDTLLRVGQVNANNVTIISDSNLNTNVTYKPDGSITAAATGYFAVCDDRGASKGNLIQIKATGRTRLIDGSDSSYTITCTSPSYTVNP